MTTELLEIMQKDINDVKMLKVQMKVRVVCTKH